MASSERLKPLVVVLCNEVILESGKQKEGKSGGKVFVRFSVKSEAATSLLAFERSSFGEILKFEKISKVVKLS